MAHLTENMKAKAGDLLAQMGPGMYETAFKKGMSLSAYLEVYEDPSEGYDDGLDAFGRILEVADLRTRSLPQLGLYASTFDDFYLSPNTRALLPEFAARIFREVKTGRTAAPTAVKRDISASSDYAPASVMPPSPAAPARGDEQIQPAIPISELIAITTPIDGDSYRSFYLTHDETKTGMVRVAETAKVPASTLTGNKHTVDLHKYGRRLVASYEMLRRMPIDLVGLHLRQIAVQTEVDKLGDIMDVIINGDGNDNAATVHDLTDLDPAATAGTLTLAGWLAFKLQFDGAYILTHALARTGVVLSMNLLQLGTANVPMVALGGAFGGLTPINRGLADAVRVGHTGEAPALKIVGIDTRFAVQQLTEIGASLTEVEKCTTQQTQDITMTEVVGFAVLDKNAARVLDINA